MNKTVVTKAEYAALKGRGPSSVSNWIAEGKLSPAALIGEGVRARIWVERADADLARSLDPAQQAAQELPIAPEPGAGLDDDDGDPAAARGGGPFRPMDDLARRRKADADRAEHEAEKARRQNEIDQGRWVVAADVRRAFARELSRQVTETETFLTQTLAREIAGVHGLDWKTVSVGIRAAWRKHRGAVADDARAQHEAMAVVAGAAVHAAEPEAVLVAAE